MTGPKDVILYIATKETTFVKRDIDMLEKKYVVKGNFFHHNSKFYTPILFFSQLFFLIKNLRKAKVIFCMFAGYHSLLPAIFSKVLGKPFVIILGGTDSVVIPTLNYGILRKGLIGIFARMSYALTHHFAPVHESLIYYENTYDEHLPAQQGIKHHVPEINAEFTVIHNGFDFERFIDLNKPRIPRSFLTVAFDLHKPNLFQLKGADLIVQIAREFPECTFTIIGLKELKDCPVNVFPRAAVTHEELLDLYNSHEFYFQLSITEGFPNALCEAMLCGCIPIVSNVSSMPGIVDGTGFVLNKRDPAQLATMISAKVLHSDRQSLSKAARERIKQSFPLEKRQQRFISLIEKLSGDYNSRT